jgi:DNA polymerase III subunit delta'
VALWLAQVLLCSNRRGSGQGAPGPCGVCQACQFSSALVHPDLHWVFPRPRAKDSDPPPADVRREYAEAIAERVRAGLLYATPDGADAIYVSTVRALVHDAVMTPALATRKVVVVGDADRMVPQEGADMAANAFLKLLEEPPADTTIILTSSAPGALLPTIRSRVVAVRVARLSEEAATSWVRDAGVRAALDAAGVIPGDEERVRRAAGSPGDLLAVAQSRAALVTAQSLVEAATVREPAQRFLTALRQGSVGARGTFADALTALTAVLHGQLRAAVDRQDTRIARATCRAIAWVEEAKGRTATNANPQLLTAGLLRQLGAAFGRDS